MHSVHELRQCTALLKNILFMSTSGMFSDLNIHNCSQQVKICFWYYTVIKTYRLIFLSPHLASQTIMSWLLFCIGCLKIHCSVLH